MIYLIHRLMLSSDCQPVRDGLTFSSTVQKNVSGLKNKFKLFRLLTILNISWLTTVQDNTELSFASSV